MIERKFGRLRSFDERSWNFMVRKQLAEGLEPKTTYWECSKVLDQLDTPRCVGYSGAHELIAIPVPIMRIDAKDADVFYSGAQDEDQWPGSDYDGSSILGMARWFIKVGFWEAVYWAFSFDDWKLGISHYGPALIGITWRSGMMEPDSNGFIHVTGSSLGGHAILANGYDHELKRWTLHNSWGREWGLNGECYVSDDDMNKSREDAAECAFAQGEKDIGDIPPPDPGNGGCAIANWFTRSGNGVARLLGSRYRVKAYKG